MADMTSDRIELAAKLQAEAASVCLLHENAVWGIPADVEGFEPRPLDQYVLTAELELGGH
jgi:peptide/nickel transport system substrate-binding protein